MLTLFDIIADRNQYEKLGKIWGLKMDDEDFERHKNLCLILLNINKHRETFFLI